MPSASYSHTAPVAAEPHVVWARLQEADAWAGIGPIDEVWDATHDPDGNLSSFHWSASAAGRNWQGTARTAKAVVSQLMVVVLDTSEVTGSITVRLGAESVHVDMSLRSVGLLATLFFSVVADAVGGSLPGHVDEFAAQFG